MPPKKHESKAVPDFLSLLFDDLHLTAAEYFFVAASDPWAIELNTQGRSVFHAVLQGEIRIRIGSEVKLLRAGDILVLPTGQRHRLERAGAAAVADAVDLTHAFQGHSDAPIILGDSSHEVGTHILSACCHFDADMGQPLLSALPAAVHVQGSQNSLPEWLRIGIEFLMQELRQSRPGRQTILNRLGDIWFIECLRTYIEALPAANDNWLRALKDPALATVLSAVHRAPEHNWRVTELAELAFLSRSAFAERFQRIMGKPPLTYVSEHRMRLASWQLKHTDQPICRIAEAVGYASETAFGQAFKRSHGLAPGQYREKTRSSPSAVQ